MIDSRVLKPAQLNIVRAVYHVHARSSPRPGAMTQHNTGSSPARTPLLKQGGGSRLESSVQMFLE